MNDRKFSSIQLPFCEALTVGINCHGENDENNNAVNFRHHHIHPYNKYLIQDVRDQIRHSRSKNTRNNNFHKLHNATHIVVKRNLKQSIVLQAISIDTNDLLKYFAENKYNQDGDFTITVYCQRAPILCEGGGEVNAYEPPIALCTLKPSAGLVYHDFNNRAFHPINGSLEWKCSINIFAVVKRNINVSVLKQKNEDEKSGRRRQRQDDEETRSPSDKSKFQFKIHIFGFIGQPIDKLASLQAWKRLDELAARHALFEDDAPMRGHIADDFSKLRESLQKKLYSFDADGEEEVAEDSDDDSCDGSGKSDDDDENSNDDDGTLSSTRRGGGGGRRRGWQQLRNALRQSSDSDGDDDDDDSDVRNLRGVLDSASDDDGEDEDEEDDDDDESRSGSRRLVNSSSQSLVQSEDLENEGNNEVEDEENEDEEIGMDDDVEGWDEDDDDDENQDEEDDEEENDIYYNETRPRAWRYSQRRQ